MTMFILQDAAGLGAGDIDPPRAFGDLAVIADDDAIGLGPVAEGLEPVTYTPTQTGPLQDRLDVLINTTWTPDYGAGPQDIDIVIIPALATFVLADGTPMGRSFTNNGTALPPTGSGLAGASLNPTSNCLVIYDTTQTICVARRGTAGTIDLPISNAGVLYHEFSHAFRILNNTLLPLSGTCNPSSPEEAAAITDENDLRTQIAQRQDRRPVLRDPGIHCGALCVTTESRSGSRSACGSIPDEKEKGPRG